MIRWTNRLSPCFWLWFDWWSWTVTSPVFKRHSLHSISHADSELGDIIPSGSGWAGRDSSARLTSWFLESWALSQLAGNSSLGKENGILEVRERASGFPHPGPQRFSCILKAVLIFFGEEVPHKLVCQLRSQLRAALEKWAHSVLHFILATIPWGSIIMPSPQMKTLWSHSHKYQNQDLNH